MVDGNFGYKSGEEEIQNFIPKITVMGVGGAGCNAVNSMIAQGIDGVDFVVANTDAQSLIQSKAGRKIQLGKQVTRGFGAGSRPEVGEKAAEESLGEITDEIKNANILFLTAGMGGGTGSGALPVIAKVAKEKGVLTVAIVTTPFEFEGKKKAKIAEEALARLVPNVDSYIVLPNQNLYNVVDKQMTFLNAFKVSDSVLCEGVKNITDLIRIPGTINLDFADIRAVMENSGRTIIGTSIQCGDDRAVKAVDGVLLNPMLQGNDVHGAKSVLVNITANPENLGLDEPETIMNNIRASIDSDDTNFYLGTCFDEKMGDSLKVAIIATGLSEVRGQVSHQTMAKSVSDVGVGATMSVNDALIQGTKKIEERAGFWDDADGENKPVSMKEFEEKPLPISETFGEKNVGSVNANDVIETAEGRLNDVNAGHSFDEFLRETKVEKKEPVMQEQKKSFGGMNLGGMSIDDFINKESERIKRESDGNVSENFGEKNIQSNHNGDDDPNNPSGGPKGGKKNPLSSFFDMLGDTKDGGFMDDTEDVFGDDGDKMMAEDSEKEEPSLEIKAVADRKPEHEESNVVFLAGSLDKSEEKAVQTDLIDVLQKMEETFDIPSIFKKSNS